MAWIIIIQRFMVTSDLLWYYCGILIRQECFLNAVQYNPAIGSIHFLGMARVWGNPIAIGMIQFMMETQRAKNPWMKEFVDDEIRWLATVLLIKLLTRVTAVFSLRAQTRARLGDRLLVPDLSRSWWFGDFAHPRIPLSPVYIGPASRYDPGLW